MKKLICTFIAVFMAFSLITPVYASNTYTDISEDAWYAESVDYVTDNALMQGIGSHLFTPDEVTTRAMVVTVLWRHAGTPGRKGHNFLDVEASDWYFTAAEWGDFYGIVKGYPIEGIPSDIQYLGYRYRFKGNQAITREELATFLYRYATTYAKSAEQWQADQSMTFEPNAFADREQVSDWAAEAMDWCVANGIIQGTPKGDELLLAPSAHATRAELAAILMRYCEMIAQ